MNKAIYVRSATAILLVWVFLVCAIPRVFAWEPIVDGYVKTTDGVPISDIWVKWRDTASDRMAADGAYTVPSEVRYTKTDANGYYRFKIFQDGDSEGTGQADLDYLALHANDFLYIRLPGDPADALEFDRNGRWVQYNNWIDVLKNGNYTDRQMSVYLDKVGVHYLGNFGCIKPPHLFRVVIPQGFNCEDFTVKTNASGSITPCDDTLPAFTYTETYGGTPPDAHGAGCRMTTSFTNNSTTITLPTFECVPKPLVKSCTIFASSSLVKQGEAVTLSHTGTSNNVVAEPSRVFIEKSDGSQLSTVPGNLTEYVKDSTYYYQVNNQVNSCTTGNNTACQTNTAVNDVSTVLPAGSYKALCDVPNAPTPCSGDPLCTYEGGSKDCSGWTSCSDSDNVSFSVAQCEFKPITINTTQLVADRGSTGTLADVTISWSQPDDSTTAYKLMLGLPPLDTSDAAFVAAVSNTNPPYAVTLPKTQTAANPQEMTHRILAADWAKIVEARLNNSNSSDLQVVIIPIGSACTGVATGTTATANLAGKAMLRAHIRDRRSGFLSCGAAPFDISTLPPEIAIPQSSLVLTANPNGGMRFTPSGSATSTEILAPPGGGDWTTGAAGVEVELKTGALNFGIVGTDYTCICGANQACTQTGVNPTLPQLMLVSFNLAAVRNWWQGLSGLLLAKSDINNILPVDDDSKPIACTEENRADCWPYQSRSPQFVIGGDSGFPLAGSISNALAIPLSSERTNETTYGANIPPATSTQILNRVAYKELHDQVAGLTTIKPESAGYIASGIPPAATGYYSIPGPVTFSPTAVVEIPATQKVVFFIDGNLTITDPRPVGSSDVITRVAPGGFLGFIVTGDITIQDSVGTALTGASPTILGTPQILASRAVPNDTNNVNLEGVFIADRMLTIAGKGPTFLGGVANKRFVGAGIFIGRSGVTLGRSLIEELDTNTFLQAGYSPAELFIHRPDMVVNTPIELQSMDTTYEEK